MSNKCIFLSKTGFKPVCWTVVFLQLIVISSSVYSQSYGGGTGTFADPYKISTPQHLVELSANVPTGASAQNVYFVLTNSIDMSGIPNFTPIGTSARPFSSNLDGKGFSIKNLTKGKKFCNTRNLFAIEYYFLLF